MNIHGLRDLHNERSAAQCCAAFSCSNRPRSEFYAQCGAVLCSTAQCCAVLCGVNDAFNVLVIDREFVTSAKKFANFNEFSEIKKSRKNSYKNSLNARVQG